jgi:hypothetical protein
MDNLIKYWKTYLIGLLVLLLVFAVGIAIHYYRSAQVPGELLKAQKILKDPSQPVLDTFRDKSGNLHSQIAANGNTIPQAVLKDTSIKRDSIIKKIDRDLSLADNSGLLEVTQENLQLKAHILKLTKDSANLAYLAYKDKSISFSYDPKDSTMHDLFVNLHLTQVKLNKRKLFSSTPVYDFYADDPRVTFSGFNHFTVAVPPPLIGLSADVKSAYDFNSGHLIPSVGLNFRVGEFSVEGRNYWSVRNQQFQQLLSLSYRQTIF